MQDKQNWQCSYCGHSQVLLEENNFKINKSTEIVRISEHEGNKKTENAVQEHIKTISKSQ